MTRDSTDGPRAASPHPGWPDSPSRDALQLIAEGVTQVAGFGVAAISVARDDGKLEVMAVAGSDAARDQLTGTRTPVDRLQRELAKADDWGLLRFVPHERLDPEVGENWGWVPDIEPLDEPDAWHPMDLLIAMLYDDQGVLRGTMSIDLPIDGRRPGEEQRRVLNQYAEQAGRAVVTALEREGLATRVRLAEAARKIVRSASTGAGFSVDRILAESRIALADGFQARGMWIQTFDEDGLGTGAIYASDGTQIELPDELVGIAESAARRAWSLQRVEVVARDLAFGPTITAAQGERVLAFLDAIGIGSILFAPLGAGPECLGNLVLTRLPGAPEWSEVEGAAALDIGHDLGRAILNARAFEREHQLVQELQALDTYKSQLISTVSHELKNPLTAIVGHLEILETAADLDTRTLGSLAAMDRGAQRLARVIDDLLLLSKVGDPNNPVIAAPIDLHRVVDEVVDLTSVAAGAKHLTITVEAPVGPVVALGDAEELTRVCANLVSNAVKYTPEGRSVRITLGHLGHDVVLACTDEGIGVSAVDQKNLFNEFFRSSNPEAVAQPGTGLGLAIVSRIVERHSGRIEVCSELGKGSTFRVFLPAAT
ncbi:MAG: ATP-binding region, ATPase domain protein [Nocardioides sp.]|jgi:signal transduction histidine kinase|nr:ATP-binding region, ATPase domain protein [Nocardioides sp.]